MAFGDSKPVIFDIKTVRQRRLQALLADLENKRMPVWAKKELLKKAETQRDGVFQTLYSKLPGLPRLFGNHSP